MGGGYQEGVHREDLIFEQKADAAVLFDFAGAGEGDFRTAGEQHVHQLLPTVGGELSEHPEGAQEEALHFHDEYLFH